ncbi:MAG: antibiotic biosynthesis monooxygenase [Pirellulaceae bacterium]
MELARKPELPYYAVIFTSLRTVSETDDGYSDMARQMTELAALQPGYLGIESVRQDIGITVSYWQDLDSIHAWKQNVQHQAAQQLGKEKWYSSYRVRICKVEQEYGMAWNPDDGDDV